MNYFLSGGAKTENPRWRSGSSAPSPGPHYYLATMIPHDDEDLLRIRRHIDDRAGLGFATVECGTDILSALGRMDHGGAVLLDSVTALLSNEMFRADGTLGRRRARTAGARAARVLPPNALLRVCQRLYLRRRRAV